MRNWTIKEAVAVVNEGKDLEAIKEIAKHFPMAFMHIAKNDLAGLSVAMGEKFTLRRVEQGFGAIEDEDADDEVMNTPEATEDGDEDLNAMSTKELMKLCDKRGIKVPHYGKNKQFYLDALQNAGGASDDTENEDEEVTDGYEGKSAQELFKECKKRGIKVEAKKNAKYYIAALKKADEAEAEEDTEEEDWDEGDDGEEEEEVKPAKTAKGGKGKAKAEKSEKTEKKAPAKTASKSKASEEEDDDDDWDL